MTIKHHQDDDDDDDGDDGDGNGDGDYDGDDGDDNGDDGDDGDDGDVDHDDEDDDQLAAKAPTNALIVTPVTLVCKISWTRSATKFWMSATSALSFYSASSRNFETSENLVLTESHEVVEDSSSCSPLFLDFEENYRLSLGLHPVRDQTLN
jgi:hypothetical protein